MHKNTSTDDVESDSQLEQVRTLILGEKNQRVTASIKKEARSLVADVFTEALHDRQKNDGSVNKVLQPLIEDSVQHSVTHNSEGLVGSLYPLVGSLVRKSVSAFLTDFMEKTNQLLENSLTIKGLKWRIKARQAGVSFAQYAASQIFIYRVEHVFLIHRETGLLLNSVNFGEHGYNDADLISSMLTAINDFVGDSFLANKDGLKEQLKSVSTDNFNLIIKAGPSALVVAAVIGQPPQKVNDQLQQTVENIHSLYIDELNNFNGDNLLFENSKSLLSDCLLSEQKAVKSKNKTPWLAWFLLLLTIVFSGYHVFLWFQNSKLATKVMQLDLQPGIVINQLDVIDNNHIKLDILRDPDAVKVTDWLEDNKLTITQLNITERNYYSLDPELLNIRAQKVLSRYPSISSTWQNHLLTLSGSLALIQTEQLLKALSMSGFIAGKNLSTEQLQLASPSSLANSTEVKQQLFDDLIGRISAIQLDFTIASEQITPNMQITLQRLFLRVQQLSQLAKDLDISFGLLIIGTSDSSGNKTINNQLSMNRAKNTADTLQAMGLNKDKMYVTGLGEIEITDISNTSRKVMFNVLFVDKAISAAKKQILKRI